MRLFTVFFTLVLVSGCSEVSSSSATQVLLDVPEIHCESCASKVTQVLREQPGVQSVSVNVLAKRATVSIDKNKFDSQAALAILEDYQFAGSTIVQDNAQ